MAWITIEVVYAEADRQQLIALSAPEGITAAEAVERSGIARFFPRLDTTCLALGIFGHSCPPDRVLEDGDRVEIYRPLRCDPREMRRRRAHS